MIMVQELSLYPDPSYTYTVNLEGNSYDITINYNVTLERWFMDIRLTGEETFLLQSAKMVPFHEIGQDYLLTGLTGYFWLVPVGESIEKFKEEPQRLDTWFKLFYVYEQEE